MALRSCSSTLLHVLAIDLLVRGCFVLVLACIVPSMFPALWGVISCMLYLQQQYFLHAHRSMLWMYWQ